MYTASRYQASSPSAKANGQVLLPYYQVLQGTDLAHLIDEYRLDELDPQAFYPQQRVCDMQSAMNEKLGLFSGELTDIGKRSIDSIPFPDNVQTVDDAMAMLHQIYQNIHQNIPAEEGWTFERISDHEILIGFNSPYEPFAAYGYIYAIARRFNPDNLHFTVHMNESEAITTYRVMYTAR